MRTVGEILNKKRLERKLTLEEVAKATRIRVNYLSSLEADDFQKLPSFVTARGFLKNYSEYLGLSSESVLAVFRRDFASNEGGKIMPQGLVNPISEPRLSFNPKATMVTFFGLFFLVLLIYLGYQYLFWVKRPYLTVTAPQGGQRVTGKSLEIVGRADPDAVVTVNGQSTFLFGRGEFKYLLELLPGENKIIIEAKSKLGKKSVIERQIWVEK